MEANQPDNVTSHRPVRSDSINSELNEQNTSSRLYFALNLYSCAAGLITIIVCFVVLAGWAFDIGALKSIFPGFATMKPYIAIFFILSGASFCLSQIESNNQLTIHIAQVSAFIVALIGNNKTSRVVLVGAE